MKLSSFFAAIFSVLLLGVSFVAFTRAQDIADWYFLRSYEPSSEIAALAENSFFSDEGRELFYVSDPEINQADAFNENCPFRERTYVLGCFSNQRIYIFDVTEERLDGIKEVTAAHEMLHVVYSRLSGSQRQAMDDLLETELQNVSNARILELIASYREADPDSIYNEMHSIFGTELNEVSAELEAHYAAYFTNRQNLVQLAKNYEAVFEELQTQAESLRDEIDGTKILIESLEEQIRDKQGVIGGIRSQLDAFRAQIDAARAAGDPEAESISVDQFNALIPQLDQVVNEHNDLVARYNAAVNDVNAKVDTYNSLIVEQGQLIDSINSKLDTIPVEE